MLFHFQPVDIILVTISELEKLGAFRNVYEDALEISFDKKNPGINTFWILFYIKLSWVDSEFSVDC